MKRLNQHAGQPGICGNIDKTQMLNPSLTFQVGMAANPQLQNWRFGLVFSMGFVNMALPS